MKFKIVAAFCCLLLQVFTIAAKSNPGSDSYTVTDASKLNELVNYSKIYNKALPNNNFQNCNNSDSMLAPNAAPCNGVSVTSISFNGASRTLISAAGTDNTVNAVYRYSNAGIAPDGTVLDALVSIVSYANNQDANLTNFSSADIPGTTAGFEENLQPNINQESGTFLSNTFWQGSINYRIRFVVTGTTTPKVITVAATTTDNDGGAVCGSTLRESVTYSSALNQVLTSITTNQTIAGNTITGPTVNQAGIGNGLDYANAALYVNVSEINWAYSFATPNTAVCTAGAASAARYGSLNLSCQINFGRNFAAVGLSGTVFNDVNGLTDSTVNGTGTNAGGLFANLVDANGFVVSSVAVAANGTYTFPAAVAGNYTVQISTNQGIESSFAPANTLPAGWANTGENIGTTAGNDGTINSSLAVTVAAAAITNVNFGIEQRPTPNNGSIASNNNTGGTVFYPIAPTAFTASDPSGGTITSIRITAFPSNAASIRINGIDYTAANFPVGGVTIPTNAAGNPTQAIAVDPINGNVTVGIPFAAIDNALVQSSTTGTVSAPFAVGPTSSNATISGRLMFGETPLANSLVVLTNTSNNAKRVVRTDGSGNYAFNEEVGAAYIIQPLSSKYAFSPSSKFVQLLENTAENNFASNAKNYRVKNDFDGDGKSDQAVYRASEGNWYILQSSTNEMSVLSFGIATDVPVAGDFDGDGKADAAVFRASEGNWYIRESSTQTLRVTYFGISTDKLVPADYDGDGKTDVAVYRDGVWYINQSSNNSLKVQHWGTASDSPSAADFDGDGKADTAVYRASEGKWYIFRSSTNDWNAYQFGLDSDVPVAADYDGDGKTDIAQFRNGFWYVLNSTTDFQGEEFGQENDQTVIGDFDGDGRADLTVFNNGRWSTRNSANGTTKTTDFGLADDILVK